MRTTSGRRIESISNSNAVTGPGGAQKLVLHIGTHKTGTTSLQQYLVGAKLDLRAQSVVYALSGRTNPSGSETLKHGPLSHDIGCSDTGVPVGWQQLFEEMAESPDCKFIISSEHFSHIARKGIQRVSDLLGDYDTRIVVYLRDPTAFMISAFNQEVKRGGIKLGFADYFSKHVDRCNYHSMLDDWASAFSRCCLVVRIYEQAKEVGILEDFANLVGLAISSNLRHAKANESPDARQVLAILRLNRLGLGVKLRKQVAMDTRIGRMAARAVNPTGKVVSYSLQGLEHEMQKLRKWTRELCGAGFLSDDQTAFVRQQWLASAE